MKLTEINLKTLQPLRDLVGYRWLKVDGTSEKSLIILPDSINDGGGEGRMGNKYSCEVLSIGPEVHTVKVGDRFVLHEYDKVDQTTPWNVEDIMFCGEGVIKIMLDKDAPAFVSKASVITDKMIEDYEEY